MSLKKQLPTLSKQCSIYEELPENFLDKTDFESSFLHSVSEISTVENRLVRLRIFSNKRPSL